MANITISPKKIYLTSFFNAGYPWDKSNLKSLQIDIKAFEKLDAYAAKVTSNRSVDLLVRDLIKDAHTVLEKTRAIWIWICHHIEYDVDGLKNEKLRSTDPDDILRTRKGVCAGYSSLFEQMCSIAGVQCKSVSGYSKGAGYNIGQKFSGNTDHAWNAVYLNNRWHLLDSTWGAGKVSENASTFNFEYDEYYFLTHPALFIGNHFPEESNWQLLESELSLEEFEQMAYLRSYFYNNGLLSVQPNKAILETVNGKATITIESRHHVLFLFQFNKTESTGLMTLTEHGMKLDVYPQKTGEHILQIFAKRGKTNYKWALDYKIVCKSVDKNMKIPKSLRNHVGPSWLSEEAGMLLPSHRDPIINTDDGQFTVTFALKGELDIFATLGSDDIKITSDMQHRHIFQRQKKIRWNLRFEDKSNMYATKCQYLVTCTKNTVQWPMFPLVYGCWNQDYELIEPLEGVLPENNNINFKFLIPGVIAVSVNGKKSFPLSLSESGYWEGTCSTNGCQDLNVAVCKPSSPNHYNYILQYKVGKKQNWNNNV
ncbi:hypothetical protein GDO86_010349 [Hymenochirus boettgeri]|uniref:Transglutaminase-like domain-containing protein n=1 Tax=Hymenochirus boettgeri TaxID=247094 RepID=A0A8T2JSN4_9PIPI|nr:hypothetical protein GDO86_010349 [Hymenochirus boettgeri]